MILKRYPRSDHRGTLARMDIPEPGPPYRSRLRLLLIGWPIWRGIWRNGFRDGYVDGHIAGSIEARNEDREGPDGRIVSGHSPTVIMWDTPSGLADEARCRCGKVTWKPQAERSWNPMSQSYDD